MLVLATFLSSRPFQVYHREVLGYILRKGEYIELGKNDDNCSLQPFFFIQLLVCFNHFKKLTIPKRNPKRRISRQKIANTQSFILFCSWWGLFHLLSSQLISSNSPYQRWSILTTKTHHAISLCQSYTSSPFHGSPWTLLSGSFFHRINAPS